MWVEYIIGRSVDTSLKKSRYFEFWLPILMSELHKFGALNLRAKSEKVKTTRNNYRTHLYRGDVLKFLYGSTITNATESKEKTSPLDGYEVTQPFFSTSQG